MAVLLGDPQQGERSTQSGMRRIKAAEGKADGAEQGSLSPQTASPPPSEAM